MSNNENNPEAAFEKWFAELKALATKADWPIGDAESWRGYFDDEYSPRDALKEDIGYVADDRG